MRTFILLATVVAMASAGTISSTLSPSATSAIVQLPQIMPQVESSASLQALTGDAKVTALVSMLQGMTSATQAPIISKITELGLSYETYWASNIIKVTGLTPATLSALAAFQGEFEIREEFTASVNPVVVHGEVSNVTQNPQWGVAMIKAPEVWSRTTGEGIVVAIIDTGVNQGHVALSAGYAGAWSDPYYSTANPTDQHGHGSHCAGTILGRENGVGVAPGARWIACRGLNHQGSGTETALTGCAQFMLTANPRPNIVSNSWGGGQGQTWYNTQVSAWRNAGIIPVFALGNSGPGCRTANSPGDQGNLISVGATTNTDAMASFSSRGPATNGAAKPEVSAPGNQIVSCGTGTNNYVTMSGTSMACPHTAGAAALLMSANPSWGFDQVLGALSRGAAHPTLSNSDRNCGLPDSPNEFPNYAFGAGRIDVERALA